MLGVGAGLAIGAGVSALGGLITGYLNNRSQQKENEIMREREDNAISRRMADLSASGLSPTLAAGSPASSQAGTANNYDSLQGAFDFASKYLSLLQGKADISHTNADTALAQINATSEQYKQSFVQAQTNGENLRNSWINADMASKLNLRDLQGNKIGEELKEINANTALLQAKTAYEQANRDFIMTQNDNARIRGDIDILERSWYDSSKRADIFNKYNSGNPIKSLLGAVPSALEMFGNDMQRKFSDFSKNWYYPNK